MDRENKIVDSTQFTEIMKNLNGKITDAFIRVSNRKNADVLDSDLINIRLSDAPITISERKNVNIVISDSGENLYSVNMYDFYYADIEGMGKESTYGFLKTPCQLLQFGYKQTYLLLCIIGQKRNKCGWFKPIAH